jgi:glycosyltransferase involved in cell wall biosynthesis
MVNLIEGLLRHDIGVDLLLPPGDYPEIDRAGLPAGRIRLDIDDPELASRQVQAYLSRTEPNALLSNKDQTHALLRRDAFPQGRPHTLFRVGTNVAEKLRRQGRLTAPWRRRRLAALLAEADGLIGISPGVTRALDAMLGPTSPTRPRPALMTIWNPVDRSALIEAAAAPVAHPWLAAPDRPVIVSVGRLVKAKDYPTLIRAFARLRAHHPSRLILIGEGRQRDRLMRLARRLGVDADLDLIGHRPNPFPLMAAADLFVVSSVFEGANNALMEAVALGIPCVATDCPSGPGDILEHGALGPLVPPGDHRALAAAMDQALRAPLDRELLRASAARFDLEKSVTRYQQALGLAGEGDA